jgi:hypothetical protein
MLFNSLTFIVFFLVVLAAYWTMGSWEARKNLLLVASYLFYGRGIRLSRRSSSRQPPSISILAGKWES